MSSCYYDSSGSYYRNYDASLCNILCEKRKNSVPLWPREYATFPTNYDGKTDETQCPKTPTEKKALQFAYKMKVIKNKDEYNPGLTKKQQYANLVNGKSNYLTSNSTYSAQNEHKTIPNTSRLIPHPGNHNILFACPVGQRKNAGPRIFRGNNNTVWKR